MMSDIRFFSDFEDNGDYLELMIPTKDIKDEVLISLTSKKHKMIGHVALDKQSIEQLIFELMKINLTLTS